MSFPKKDRKVPALSDGPARRRRDEVAQFQEVVAAALHREYGSTHAAIKTVVALTGAHERAVKNWFSAKNGPSGAYVAALCRHSDEVLSAFLTLADRTAQLKTTRVVAAVRQLRALVRVLEELESDA